MTIDEIEETLLLISEKSLDEGGAVAAFTNLYKNYSKFLNTVISGVLKISGIYDEHVLNTVMNNTFYKLYEDPLAFSFPKDTVDDKTFKAWLSVVAKNELKGLLKEYYHSNPSLEEIGTETVAFNEELPLEVFESANMKVLNDALNTLSERDRHILLTLYLYYEDGKKTPSDTLDLLCEMHGTTKVNIRKIRERSEKKIIDYITQHTQLKPLKNVK
ncbi:sigma-70 family RNA polymerase sigma factor [Chryseobacterium vrystaatense]|uniref:RNA polymerase sigma factor, sigma-70 family n=1 Tax=Chryseobacterium vrystaatense TaxID=307480 RepID=A0A1M5GSU9_9FLAO|nr:sigma-70 family RNA polymerase sigma factor [Chryseobacterium vrystaatense]SHG06844.1 RNA polymerase sigma factor, sigma-70 family [Chryseobacterium vrystaatense]